MIIVVVMDSSLSCECLPALLGAALWMVTPRREIRRNVSIFVAINMTMKVQVIVMNVIRGASGISNGLSLGSLCMLTISITDRYTRKRSHMIPDVMTVLNFVIPKRCLSGYLTATNRFNDMKRTISDISCDVATNVNAITVNPVFDISLRSQRKAIANSTADTATTMSVAIKLINNISNDLSILLLSFAIAMMQVMLMMIAVAANIAFVINIVFDGISDSGIWMVMMASDLLPIC